jgi:hypothetical protein
MPCSEHEGKGDENWMWSCPPAEYSYLGCKLVRRPSRTPAPPPQRNRVINPDETDSSGNFVHDIRSRFPGMI